MRRTDNGQLVLSASDVADHLGCRHLTELNRRRTAGEIDLPHFHDSTLVVLRELGERHEAAYVDHLAAQGLGVHRCPDGLGDAAAVDWTLERMRAGVDVIVQGRLAADHWFGIPDILRRVSTPSDFGAYAYEVEDTKLARQTRAGTVLQLCLYSELLARAQGVEPEAAWVVPRVAGFERERFRLASYMAYFRHVAQRTSQQAAAPAQTAPVPCEKCITCRWRPKCNDDRRSADDLSLVAGLGSSQRRELQDRGIHTTSALADLPQPVPFRPDRGSVHTYNRLQRQARLQVESRGLETPKHEFQPVEEGFGLTRLPPPNTGDVFFDFEGDPWCGDSGLEYLFGWIAWDDTSGQWCYHDHWAFDERAECAAFEATIDWLMARWRKHADMHIYHFGHYEPSAFKRLMGRYATREEELDRLLRGGVFVDLHTVARQALVIGTEGYSLKHLEPVHGFVRATPLPDAGRERAHLEGLLALGDAGSVPDTTRSVVREYNREDCASTRSLRDWLEARRDELVACGIDVPRLTPGEPEPSQDVSARDARISELAEQLRAPLPDDRDQWPPEHHARNLLADLLGYHRREDKCDFWEKFRLQALEPDEMFSERRALAGLEHVCELPPEPRARTPVHRYRFPPQEVSMRVGRDLLQHEHKIGSVAALDLGAHTVDIKKTGDTVDVHPTEVYQWDFVPSDVLAEALFRLAESVRDGTTDDGQRAAIDLLARRAPRLKTETPWEVDGETTLHRAVRLARGLNSGVLGIQGPPGAGKTYAGAHIIEALVADGRKVGVTALSHKAIANLLRAVRTVAPHIQVGRKPGSDDPVNDDTLGIPSPQKIAEALQSGELSVIGATAFAWANPALANAVDVLIVDEASQLPLATTLAAAQSARNLILLGDPAQLEQPQNASHPPGSEVSALTHLLGDAATMPEDRGLFLPDTWRLHPDICAFTSEIYYEGRLQSAPGCEQQRLEDCGEFTGNGLFYVPVEHAGNASSSPEEVEAVVAITHKLLGGTWVDRDGERRELAADDILIVAPFNDQVGRLMEALPDFRIGTVDRFQGQQAPVVIYSMASSTPDDAPRGIGFLHDPHRINVATSRAKCACVVAASPALLTPECRTPDQIEAANALSRFVEVAAACNVACDSQ